MPTATLRCRCGCKQRARREEMLITPSGAAFLSAEHAASYGQKRSAALRVRKARDERDAFKQRKRAFHESNFRKQFGLTKRAAQALAMQLDAGMPCISCGTTAPVQYCGGHYKTAGAHPELALDLRNIHRQCNRNCNCGLSGNIEGTRTTFGYRHGLVARFGADYVDFLERARPPAHFTCDELISMRREYAAEIRRLKQGLPASRNWRELPQPQPAHEELRLSGRAEEERAA